MTHSNPWLGAKQQTLMDISSFRPHNAPHTDMALMALIFHRPISDKHVGCKVPHIHFLVTDDSGSTSTSV